MARGEVRFRLVAENEQAKKALDEISNQVEKLGGTFAAKLGPAGAVLEKLGPAGLAAAAGIGAVTAAGAALGAFLADSTKKAIDYGSRIQDLADSSGIGAEALQRLKAAGLSTGTSLEETAAAAKKLQDALVRSPDKFDQLGLSAEKLIRMKPDEALRATAAAINELNTQAEKTAAARDLLGKGFDLKFLKNLADPELSDRAERLGQVLSKDMVSGLDDLDDELAMVGATWEAFQLNLGGVIATTPGVLDALKGVTDSLGELSTWVKENKDGIQGALKGAAEAGATAFKLLSGEVLLTIERLEKLKSLLPSMSGGGGAAGSSSGKGLAFGALALNSLGFGSLGTELLSAYAKGAGPAPGAAGPAAGGLVGPPDLGNQSVTAKAGGRSYDPNIGEKRKKQLEEEAKAQREVEKGQERWWRLQEQQEQTEQRAHAALVEWFEGITGPSGAKVESELLKISDAIEQAGGKTAFSKEQLDNLRVAIAKLRAESPEGFNAANEATGGQLGNMLLVVKQEGPQVLDTVKKKTNDWCSAMQDVSDVLGQIAQDLGGRGIAGGIASLASGAAGAIANIERYKKSGGWAGMSASDKISGAASALGVAGQIYQQNRTNMSAAGGALSGAGMGAKEGAKYGGPWGAVIGGVVGAGIGLFAGAGFRKMAKEAGKTLGVEMTKELAITIDETKKKLGVSTGTAALLNIGAAMGDKDPRTFSKQIVKLMEGIKDGSVPAKEGLQELAQDFGAVADAALKAGSVGDKALVGIIKRSRELGVESPEIKQFVQGQLQSAAGGVGGMVSGIKLNTQDDAKAQGTIFATTFWATVGEMGIIPAADAFKDTFAKLEENLSAGGFDISGILGPIEQIMGLAGNDTFRGAADGAASLKQALEGVANAGYLTTDSFSAFEQQAQAAFNQAVAGGASTQQAFQTIAPLLQSLVSASGNYDINLDDATKSLIEQAKAAGVAFKTDSTERLTASIDALTVALGGVPPKVDEIGRSLRNLPDIPFPGNTITDNEPVPGGGMPKLADGGWVPPRAGGTPVIAGEGGKAEFVGDRDAVAREFGMGSANVVLNANFTFYGAGNDAEIRRSFEAQLRDGPLVGAVMDALSRAGFPGAA